MNILDEGDVAVLPPWPAGAPVACVGTEERVGACWTPPHCGSSAPTGSQTNRGRKETSPVESNPKRNFHLQRFAKLHLNKAQDFWNNVLWTDQTKVEMFAHNAQQHV